MRGDKQNKSPLTTIRLFNLKIEEKKKFKKRTNNVWGGNIGA